MKGHSYPYTGRDDYDRSVRAPLASGQFTTILDMDGYLVLQRNTG